MTLITRFDTAFTDASLPKLRADPVISVGTTFLWEPKSVASHPGQEAAVTSGVWAANRNAAADEYFDMTGLVYPTPGVRGGGAFGANRAFSAAGGGFTNPSNVTPALSMGHAANVFPDRSHDYCITFWRRLSSSTAQANSTTIFGARSSTPTATPAAGAIAFNFNVNGTFSLSDSTVLPGSITARANDVIDRQGLALKYDAGWKFKHVIGEASFLEWAPASFPDNPALGIDNRSIMELLLFPHGSSVLYRCHIEDLTVSGRTAEQLWAADWAFCNGRFS